MARRILPVTYSTFRKHLLVGDILLSRACSMEGRIITDITRSEYSHSAMVGTAGYHPNRVWMLGETREHRHARLIALSTEIACWPGYYDVFRLRGKWAPSVAWAFACRAAGSRYSWRHNSRVLLRRWLGEWVPPVMNSDSPEWPRNCSSLIHAAMRAGGRLPLKEYDCDVVPGDLCDPQHCDYVATLFWSAKEVFDYLKNRRVKEYRRERRRRPDNAIPTPVPQGS